MLRASAWMTRALDHLLASRGERVEALAAPREQREAELVLELLELLAQRRLRGVDLLRGLRDVESGIDDGEQAAQLHESH